MNDGHDPDDPDYVDDPDDVDHLSLAGHGDHHGHATGGPQTDGFAIAALACAIAAFVAPVVPAVAALYLAAASDNRIAATPDRLGGAGLNQASRTLAWLAMALFVALVVLVLAGIAGKVVTGD